MEYNFKSIEEKWQDEWRKRKSYKTIIDSSKPKYYVLDMFPYPSGAGLHVGHPLGYIASDIVSRYKRQKGFNVLHPMGYDAFGLPAEQYAIQTGQHPRLTTNENIARYREQLDNIGFSFDWEREIRTCEPEYYKWTQWIFIQLFHSWYNKNTNRAESIQTLISEFENSGNSKVNAACEEVQEITASDWASMDEETQQSFLLNYRLAYLSDAWVNWCPALGTVLANDEVKDGVSERGGYLVERKQMPQWSLRITAYADRLLQDLEGLDWTESIKEAQRNWIGKSEGTSIKFEIDGNSIASPQPPDSYRDPKEREFDGESFHYLTADSKIYSKLKQFARELRNNSTKAEDIVWEELRNNKLGFKIRRQHPLGAYIADFICIPKKLIIEIDGEVHKDSVQFDIDIQRTDFLNEIGFEVLRFNNEEVFSDLNSVLNKITSKLNSITPSTLERGQGGEAISSDKDNDSKGSIPSSNSEKRQMGEAYSFIEVFTTRPDTIFGVSFVTLAPEHELVNILTTADRKNEVEEYVTASKNRSERERQADVKKISGVFTGSYVLHPFTGDKIPVWVGDYVLVGYGTGAVMAVPAHDSRDFAFANYFNLPIKQVIKPSNENDFAISSYDEKFGTVINSDFLNGLEVKSAIKKAIEEIDKRNLGKGRVNYRLRDAAFGRQRYWGEPIPIYYKNNIAYTLPENELPLILPEVDKYQPTESGEPPLARANNWKYKNEYSYETTTMPGWAGSSWYFLRYMDHHNNETLVSDEAVNYWKNVDFYIGGAEHATGHLLYVRFWTKFLFDLGIIPMNEPAQKLINQGMIQGVSAFVYRIEGTNKFVSHGLKEQYSTSALHVDINIAPNNILDLEKFKIWRSEFKDTEFILEDGKYVCGSEVEKMSKSKWNVVNPDQIIEDYGADTLRLYEMFLGPLEQSKPWNVQGISGVHNFLRRLWRLFHDKENNFLVSDDEPNRTELKTLHKTIKKFEEDIERYSFNTSVSTFMICVNELTDLKCNKRAILEPLTILISAYAPHIAEELWEKLGNTTSITIAEFPKWNEAFLVEDSFEYPVSINGKLKFKVNLSLKLTKEEIEDSILRSDEMSKFVEGAPKKIIVVPGRIVNVVV